MGRRTADILDTQVTLDFLNRLEGITAELVDDGENPIYLQVHGYEGKVMDIYADITEEEFALDSLINAEVWNRHSEPWNKTNVFTEIAGSGDTLDLFKGIIRVLG